MELGDLPSVKTAFPDEAHEALRRYVDATTVGVDDLAIAMQALAQLAGTFFAALDASLEDRAKLRTDVDALAARVTTLESQRLRGTTGSGSVTTLLGGTSNVNVTLKSAMPDANWLPFVWVDATTGLNLSSVTATVTARTATTATVRIAYSGLSIGSTVNFTVLALALN